VLRTPSGKIELAPEPLVADLDRLRASMRTNGNGNGEARLRLIGRRDLRSNNSWMHNVDVLVKGKPRCTVHMHPDDASRAGVANGDLARVRSASGEIVLPAEVTDAIMPGVVSIPHGWGHDVEGVDMRVATAHGGANSNVLTGTDAFDPMSGNAVLNGIPVEIAPAR
jgi:anaerobic selenocysteine-containing dehydrogenase